MSQIFLMVRKKLAAVDVATCFSATIRLMILSLFTAINLTTPCEGTSGS